MKVWTVSSTDNPAGDPLDHCVAGSYTSREQALDECVKYIMERLRVRDDLARSMAHDESHRKAAAFFVKRRDGRTAVRRGCVGKLRAYLAAELARHPYYYVSDGSSEWDFDVDESQVEGELWHTVTWGDSDCEDPEFTTPWPEDFTSRETAVKTFVDYARDLFKSHGLKFTGVEDAIRKSLDEDGRVQVDLSDGCCVSCVLYHGDAKNVKA